MSTAAITSISTMERSATICIRCRDKGHTCYASHIQDGVALCIYCMDDEPCFFEQRNKSSQPSPAPRIVPKKESPMVATAAVSTPKMNGHAPAATAEKRCAGYNRECTEMIGAMSRIGLCSTCYARKKYADKYSAAARGNPAPKPKAPKVAATTVTSAAPPVAARVSLEVTETQLNQFLVKLPLADKQRLANYFLQNAEEISVA